MIIANISTSLDGYITGPDDGPGCGLGVGGERLHYWVFGGPWTYADEHSSSAMAGEDQAFYEGIVSRVGAVITGRGTYDVTGAWGGANPWDIPCIVLTHHPDDQPHVSGFEFASSFEEAVTRAAELAGTRDVSLMGGAEVIRQGLAAGVVDEFGLSIAPVVLGAGKRLFEGFDTDVDLTPVSVRQSPYATHVWHTVNH
jgi:dihydrofolate reductase